MVSGLEGKGTVAREERATRWREGEREAEREVEGKGLNDQLGFFTSLSCSSPKGKGKTTSEHVLFCSQFLLALVLLALFPFSDNSKASANINRHRKPVITHAR